ncbi:glycosyltransferase family 2 protein [Glacieibacterium frigidum]|uniref:Glycosyltransferase family 2 protein n=1 Tax=Glacieibacterium frigidum TaxID=2593303 RepID=A0A552UAU0_9SPHN|nr:glycosyltransferase family 2 protein [Glacieibacterium frigidum]
MTVVILTFNEARHIARAIASVQGLATRIVVVDSDSTDDTVAIAAANGAEVLVNPWINYATQFNWALDNAGIDTDWTLRLDADEIIEPGLAAALRTFLGAPGDAAGATVDRRIDFLGRAIRWGGVYPVRQLRLWRSGRGRCESRWMDEHITVDGPIAHLSGGDLADVNLNNLGWWTAKHNGYATREAIDELLRAPVDAEVGGQAGVKRWIKHKVYHRLPLGSRALAYFIYRYVLRLGFLDGWPGLVFHALQGGWYRFLVDAKIAEIRGLMRARGASLAQVVADEYGHRI